MRGQSGSPLNFYVVWSPKITSNTRPTNIIFTKLGFFTMGSNLEGIQYPEVGLSKKEARKYCAMEALKVLYNVQYPGTLEDYMINCEHQDILDY